MISRADKLATAHGVAKVIDAMERAMANGWQGWDQPTLFKEIATPPQQRQRIRLADDDN
jgi:hypothetical protein